MKSENVVGASYGSEDSFSTSREDRDGNIYDTITIGTQMWMKENLKTTRFNDDTSIPFVTDATEWFNLTTPDYCWYDNDEDTNKDTYGAMYNWYTVGTGNLCPDGWHVPTDGEWTIMEDYLIANGYNYDGTTTGNKTAKSLASTTNWTLSTNIGTVGNTDFPTYRNKTGFTALPGGNRHFDDTFYGIVYGGYWWSSAEENATNAWYRYVFSDYSNVGRSGFNKDDGFYVRCLRDN